MTRPTTRIIEVVLLLPRRNRDLITYCKNIVILMTNNVYFLDPSPTLLVIAALIAAFDESETAAARKGVGLASERDARKKDLKQGLNHLRDYVQLVVESSPYGDGIAIVESSGMKVKKHTPRSKAALAVKDGPTSGVVVIDVKVLAAIASYYWQFSLDGEHWSSAPETLQATTTIGGLTPGQSYLFRYRTLTRAGATDWSQVVRHRVK